MMTKVFMPMASSQSNLIFNMLSFKLLQLSGSHKKAMGINYEYSFQYFFPHLQPQLLYEKCMNLLAASSFNPVIQHKYEKNRRKQHNICWFVFCLKGLPCLNFSLYHHTVKIMSNTKYSYYSYWIIFDIEGVTLK